MTRLFLVRHGPTHAKTMVGWSDLPADLSDRAALDRLAGFLPDQATVISSDGHLTAPAIANDVVDTTGAGDAFNAGFLSQWLGGAPLDACLVGGNRRGSLAVATRGGFSIEPPSRSANTP